MQSAAAPLLEPGQVMVPVPAHWSRFLRRRYNQAALLAKELARLTGATYLPDALIRTRRTAVQDGMGLDQRFQNMSHAIAPHPKYGGALIGKEVLLIDDVMTSGATLAAAAEATFAAGATRVCVLALARVAKDA